MKNRLLFIFTIFLFNCFSANAQNWIWGTEGSAPTNVTEGNSVATDASGNSYLTGWFAGSVTIGLFTLNSGVAQQSAFIIKYDVNGNVLWAHQSITPASEKGLGVYSISDWVTTDKQGNAYITGYFAADTTIFGLYKLGCSLNEIEMFIAKYDPNGNVVWVKQSSSGGASFALDAFGFEVSTDHSGNVYVTGAFQEKAVFDTIVLNGYESYFVAKYDSTGKVLWAKAPSKVTYAGNSVAISTDRFGNSYIAGQFSDTMVIGKTTLIGTNRTGSTGFVAKYDSAGNAIWANKSSAPSSNFDDALEVDDIAVDTYNGVYLIGFFTDTVVFGNFTLVSPASTMAYNMFFVKYDSTGKVLWAKSSSGDPNSSQWKGFSVAADTLGNIFLTASDNRIGYDSINFDSVTFQVTNTNDGNSLILEMDTSGKVLCGTIVPGGGDDRNCISTSPGGKYVNFGGDLETTIITGPDTLKQLDYEVPLMTQWNPCYSSAIKLANQVNYNCTTKTATAIVTPIAAQVSSVTWNTSPKQIGDTATNLIPGTYIATTILTNVPDTVYDTVIINSAGFIDTFSISPSSSVICSGQSILLSATALQTYQWSPSISLNTSTGSTVTASPIVTTTYTVIGKNSGGCADTVKTTVVVNPKPKLNLPAPPTICNGSADTVIVSGANSYVWSPLTGLNLATGDSIIANPTTSTTYTIVGLGLNGCADTSTIDVTVAPVLSLSTVNPLPKCNGSSDTLTVSGANSYTWSPLTGLNSTTGSITIATPTITTTYTINGTSLSGCSGTIMVTVIIDTIPSLTIATSSSSVCNGEHTTLIVKGAATYTWSPSTALSATTGDSIVANPSVTITFTVTGTNSLGCSSMDTDVVPVVPPPALIITPQSPIVCDYHSVTLTAPTSGSNYEWTPAAGLSATTGDTVIANPTITTSYTITGTDSLGCIATDTDIINIITGPNAPIITVSITGDTLISSARNGNQWYRNDTLIKGATDSILVITGLPVDTYKVEVIDEANGCSNISDSVVVVPTGINPLAANSDQLSIYPNPTAGLFTITVNGNQNGNTVEIYDVMGEMVYKAVISNSQSSINLSSQPAGMYFVYLKSDEGVEVGVLQLISF